MKIKLFSLFAALWLAAFSIAYSETTPAAQEVIDSFIVATGGAENKKEIESLVFTGSYNLPEQGIEAEITLYFQQPFRFSMILDIPNVGQMRSAYDGKTGWEMNDVTGFRLIEGSELEQLSRQATVFPELYINDNYKSADRIEDRDDGKIVIELVTNNDFTETWIFDPETHLLIEIKSTIDAGAQGSFPITNRLYDYKSVGNILVPFKTVSSNPAFSLEIQMKNVQLNTEIPAHIFEKPNLPQ